MRENHRFCYFQSLYDQSSLCNICNKNLKKKTYYKNMYRPNFKLQRYFSEMFVLTILYLLFLLFSHCFKIVRLNNDEKCGPYQIEELQKIIQYKSHCGARKTVKTSGRKDFSGSFGKVSIGLISGNGKTQCVAVKFLEDKDGESEKYYKKATQVAERIEQRLERRRRQHLIELIDAGIAKKKDGEKLHLLIMELGTETFADRLYDRKEKYENDRDWMKMIAKLAQPLMEFHKVAIHMDIKASNYLYVPQKGEMLLKLIDFDGAQFIESRNKNDTISPEGWVYTAEYCAPEFDRDNLISRKFDIWSLGMLIYEAFIDKLRQENENKPLVLDDRRRFLTDMRNLHEDFKKSHILKMAGKSSAIASIAEFDESTWQRHNNVIDIVLQFWHKYPKTALLVTNMLHPTRQQRLTAKSILDYLRGKCYIKEFKWVQTAKKLRIFNYIKFGELKQKIVKKQRLLRVQMWKKNRQVMKVRYAKMKRMLNEIMRGQQQEMDGMNTSQPMTICENE